MIYFDRKTRKNSVEKIFAKAPGNDDHLFIGHSGLLIGKTTIFEYMHVLKAHIYRLAEYTV